MAIHEEIPLRAVVNGEPDTKPEVTTEENIEELPDIRGDRKNIALLLVLYLLQGVPFGLSAAIPMLLQKRGASYQTQAKFTIVWWPFTLKLLWAPIVDACFSSKFGRRKSWLVPLQYMIGITMIIMSFYIDQWTGEEAKGEMNIFMLGITFFTLTLLAATQDIVVDGWSLTMLKRRNVGYASACNSVGNSIGFYFGYGLLVSLESAEFCNTYLRSEPLNEGMWSLAGLIH